MQNKLVEWLEDEDCGETIVEWILDLVCDTDEQEEKEVHKRKITAAILAPTRSEKGDNPQRLDAGRRAL